MEHMLNQNAIMRKTSQLKAKFNSTEINTMKGKTSDFKVALFKVLINEYLHRGYRVGRRIRISHEETPSCVKIKQNILCRKNLFFPVNPYINSRKCATQSYCLAQRFPRYCSCA